MTAGNANTWHVAVSFRFAFHFCRSNLLQSLAPAVDIYNIGISVFYMYTFSNKAIY